MKFHNCFSSHDIIRWKNPSYYYHVSSNTVIRYFWNNNWNRHVFCTTSYSFCLNCTCFTNVRALINFIQAQTHSASPDALTPCLPFSGFSVYGNERLYLALMIGVDLEQYQNWIAHQCSGNKDLIAGGQWGCDKLWHAVTS